MYAGRVAETGRHDARSSHTRCIPTPRRCIASIPQLDTPPHTLLRAIEGARRTWPRPPPGCRFAPRCPQAQDLCRTELPLLRDPRPSPVDAEHLAACHYPLLEEED